MKNKVEKEVEKEAVKEVKKVGKVENAEKVEKQVDKNVEKQSKVIEEIEHLVSSYASEFFDKFLLSLEICWKSMTAYGIVLIYMTYIMMVQSGLGLGTRYVNEEGVYILKSVSFAIFDIGFSTAFNMYALIFTMGSTIGFDVAATKEIYFVVGCTLLIGIILWMFQDLPLYARYLSFLPPYAIWLIKISTNASKMRKGSNIGRQLSKVFLVGIFVTVLAISFQNKSFEATEGYKVIVLLVIFPIVREINYLLIRSAIRKLNCNEPHRATVNAKFGIVLWFQLLQSFLGRFLVTQIDNWFGVVAVVLGQSLQELVLRLTMEKRELFGSKMKAALLKKILGRPPKVAPTQSG